jgi:trimethylamine---corrinoid protein Co-methyltransferase
MHTLIQVLSAEDCAQIHERSLRLLEQTGVRVMSDSARKILRTAGARVAADSDRVRFPSSLVEGSLKLAPTRFQLGARRPGWNLEMNAGRCWLVADGGAVSVLEPATGDLRPGTLDDWLTATRLIDALDEIGVYWNMVEGGIPEAPAGYVEHWRTLLNACSKHVQDSVESIERAHQLLQVLDIAFGGRQNVRREHPFSYVLCPMSPLVIDADYTDIWLETVGWEIPVAIMPMPLMGATAPASLLSAVLVANADFLATLCLVQAASPGVPVIYAAVPQAVEPHSWRFTGGAIENSLLGAAVTAMARHYGLPAEAGAGGTDQYRPGAQAAYERALNWIMPALAWPDLLVGPGLLGGSTILSLDQMLLDVEVFRRCMRLHRGVAADADVWLDDLIRDAGPGANFVGQKSTLKALHEGTFYLGQMGFRGTHEQWKAAGMPDVLDELPETRRRILTQHRPLPLDPAVDRELERLAQRTRASGTSGK